MKKFISTIVNIISAIVAVIAFSIFQMDFPQNDISALLNTSSFEKTTEFNELLTERINEVFSLITLKNCFENNGELNYDTIVAETINKDNGIQKWTVKMCLEKAVEHGLYIDNDFNVNISNDQYSIPFSKNTLYNFMFKVYPSNTRTGASTEEEFLTEFMSVLSKYYKANSDLNENTSNFGYKIYFFDDFTIEDQMYSNTSLTNKNILDSNAFIYLSSRDNIISSNIDFINVAALKNAKNNNPFPTKYFTFYCYVDTKYSKNDIFATNYYSYNHLKNHCAILITTIFVSVLVFIISLILTLAFILSTKKSVDESIVLFHTIPTEFYIIIYIVLITSSILIVKKILNSEHYMNMSNILPIKINIYFLIAYCYTILLCTILTSKFANDTLMPISIKAIKENTEQGVTNITTTILFTTIIIPIIAFLIVAIYLIYLFSMSNDYKVLIIGIVMLIATFGFIIYLLLLHNAFNKSIEVQIKANEMKTSLITNVSHDIKTPLTSILNYTNLISEEISHPNKNMIKNLENYSKSITNGSYRLNNLINDLIFDSKVSSGNIELNMQKISLNAFITQVITEFADSLNENGIKVIYNCTAKKTDILADSSQLYRVFQNLFSNINKYALENSRVYIDLESKKSKLLVTMKNIQKEKLEVDVDTLTDRFVRGNKSRSTEGFGLGLSIADNLIHSMNGKLEISSKRDLFITKITFIIYDE